MLTALRDLLAVVIHSEVHQVKLVTEHLLLQKQTVVTGFAVEDNTGSV